MIQLDCTAEGYDVILNWLDVSHTHTRTRRRTPTHTKARHFRSTTSSGKKHFWRKWHQGDNIAVMFSVCSRCNFKYVLGDSRRRCTYLFSITLSPIKYPNQHKNEFTEEMGGFEVALLESRIKSDRKSWKSSQESFGQELASQSDRNAKLL